MKILTYDLNSARYVDVREVTKDDYDRTARLFGKWIAPSLNDLNRGSKGKSFRNIGSHYFTAWVRYINYVKSGREVVYCFRPSWSHDAEDMRWLALVGFTFWEKTAGRNRCPWVIHQSGIYEVHLSERAYAYVVDWSESRELLGLSNAS